MNVDSWMARADADAERRSGTAERAWAWAHVAQAAALSEICNAPPGQVTDAVWVEPALAWTLDDLTDAGVRAAAPEFPPIPLGGERQILLAALHRLASCAESDAGAPRPVSDACAKAAWRATIAITRLASTEP